MGLADSGNSGLSWVVPLYVEGQMAGVPRAVSEILCPVKAAVRVVAPWGRDDLTALNADTQFPKPQ